MTQHETSHYVNFSLDQRSSFGYNYQHPSAQNSWLTGEQCSMTHEDGTDRLCRNVSNYNPMRRKFPGEQRITANSATEINGLTFRRSAMSRFWRILSAFQRTLPFMVNPLNAEINPTRHLLALVGARHIVHVSRVRVNSD
jgi:hypothetical protein